MSTSRTESGQCFLSAHHSDPAGLAPLDPLLTSAIIASSNVAFKQRLFGSNGSQASQVGA